MAKKFAEVFDEETLDLKKPAGCISGIFQLFDCQQLLGGRQLSEQNNRRNPSVHTPVSPSTSLSCNLEKNQNRRSQDNPRYSMESSRTSFSSTSTSFSSLERKSPQEEPTYTHHSFFSERSPRNSPSSRTTGNSKFPAFKEIIKESIYRDLCSSTNKEDDNNRKKVLKPIHSPRPMDLSKVNDLDESLRIALKLKNSPCSFYEGHSPRFSYDGTEISQALIKVKQYSKHSEFSRLSMDSREGSIRCNLSPKFNSAMKEFDKDENKKVPAPLNQLQDLESKDKNSSIVAKLMGLEPKSYEQKNQIVGNERKHEKPLQSPRNIARSPRRNNLHLNSPSKFSIEETPLMARGFLEENMKQKIESVFTKEENRLPMLQCHHSSKELQDLKRVILEAKKNGNRKLSSVNSLSTQLAPPNNGSYQVSISKRTLKSPIVIMEPARRLDVSFSKVSKLEGLAGFGKIRTSYSGSNRTKKFFNTLTNDKKSFTDKTSGPHSLSKEQNERTVNNNVSPRLQQMKIDLKIKASAAIPTYDWNKSPRRPVNGQLLDSLSPRCKLRNKQNKVQDIELQNSGKKVNVEATRAKNSFEMKSLLFQQSIQSSSVKVSTGVASVSEAKKHSVILKDLSAKELNVPSPQRSSPRTVPDALLNQDGLLHSPVSISKVFKDYQNLRSDHNFIMECPHLTIPSAVSSRTDSEISESKNTISQGTRVLGTTINEARLTNADLLSMLEHITSEKPFELVQKGNLQKLQQRLIFDVVNEILAQKMDVSNCGRFDYILHPRSFSIKRIYEEICSEIKCLKSCKEGNLDDYSMTQTDVLWHSQAWDSFESAIPGLVLEIERLIFKDLINEVVNGVAAVALYTKPSRHRQMFAKDGI